MIYGIAIFLQTRKTANRATGRAYFITANIVIGYLYADAEPNTTLNERIVAINLFLLCSASNSLSTLVPPVLVKNSLRSIPYSLFKLLQILLNNIKQDFILP